MTCQETQDLSTKSLSLHLNNAVNAAKEEKNRGHPVEDAVIGKIAVLIELFVLWVQIS